jgi:hypothetical protein
VLKLDRLKYAEQTKPLINKLLNVPNSSANKLI